MKYGTNTCKSIASQGVGTTVDEYAYLEGYAPENIGEIAITKIIADKLEANIGDTVTIIMNGQDKPFLITALYQSMNNMGEGIRFNENENIEFSQAMGYFAHQITLNEKPADKDANAIKNDIEEIFPDNEVQEPLEYMDGMMGGTTGILNALKNVILAVVLLINMLVAVLMEKAFITKEKGEIGMLKAIGFENETLVYWQTLRIGFVMILSILISMALSVPFFKVVSEPIFGMMGAESIDIHTNVMENFVIYPMIMLVVTMMSTLVSAMSLRNISAAETSNIE